MTYATIRSAIEQRIATEMAIMPSYSVSYQNVPFTPPNDSPWLQVFLRFGDNAYATLRSFNRQSGVLVVNIFTPQSQGTAANYTIAERIRQLFDRLTLSGIIFDAASGPAVISPASPQPYFQTQLSVTFSAFVD